MRRRNTPIKIKFKVGDKIVLKPGRNRYANDAGKVVRYYGIPARYMGRECTVAENIEGTYMIKIGKGRQIWCVAGDMMQPAEAPW